MNKSPIHASKRSVRSSLAAALLAGLAAAGAAAPVLANPSDVPQAVVRYGDLDLNSAQGMRTLHRRLDAAARSVCPSPSIQELTRLNFAEACRARAVARAIGEIKERRLAKLSRPGSNPG